MSMRMSIVVAVLVVAALGAASAAQAAQRYASPTGTGPACTQATPCSLDTAVEDASVVDGDEVIVTSGTYSIVDLQIFDAIDLHGEAAQPAAIINTSAPASAGVYIGDAATVRDLKIEAASGTAIGAFADGVVVDRVYAHTAAGGAIVCNATNSAVIRDSVCWGSGTNSRGVGSNLSGGGPATIRLRNVTAIGTFFGLGFDFTGSSNTFTIDAKNVIADGATADVRARADTATVDITLSNSNYATEQELANSGGTASVTDPGTPTNQTASPAFVSAGTGDFHQQSSSPTVDAGGLDGFTGPLDFEGDARTLEGDGVCPTAPDIGADELIGSGPIDCDPPETTISGVPTGTTSDSTPTFTLESDEPGSSFECRVDGGAFAPCPSSYTTPELADGEHTLEARATDPATNVDPTPASRTFRVDTDPPETTISGVPTGTTSDSTPTFTLGSDEPGSDFECRIDGGTFAPCTSPYTTPELADGEHTLEARATDPSSNVDPTPASRTFTVDTDPPETTISGGPTGTISDRTPTFTFGADEAAARFECRLDGGSFTLCTSPHTAPSLGDGTHTLSVRAVDGAGNPDSTPATRTFRVDATAPETAITSAPKRKVKTKRKRVRVALSFTADEPGSFECSLDGAGFAACTSPQRVKVGKGRHVWAVRAVDRAGNVDRSPAKTTFKVKRKKKRR